jgi:hypothetical protein
MSHVVSKRKAEKQKQGLLAQIHGGNFETKVLNYYVERGFSVRCGVKNRYGEFDLIATREGSWRKKRHTLLIECKKMRNIPFKEFVKFVRKCKQYVDYYGPREGGRWEGIFAYVGELDPETRPYLNSIPDNDWIHLQQFRK